MVCCESACPAPGNCDVPGHAGTCIEPAPAPALSGTGLLIAALLLAGIGTAGLIRKRRQDG
jgi:MYXO-CTERM domain-containing protein